MGRFNRLWGWNKYDEMPPNSTKDNASPLQTDNMQYMGGSKTRVPSLKRNKKTWRNFYNIFPGLKGKDSYRGIKLRPWSEVKPEGKVEADKWQVIRSGRITIAQGWECGTCGLNRGNEPVCPCKSR